MHLCIYAFVYAFVHLSFLQKIAFSHCIVLYSGQCIKKCVHSSCGTNLFCNNSSQSVSKVTLILCFKVRLHVIDHSRNTITYHNALCLSPQSKSIVFSFSSELKWPQEKLKTMLMQNFGVTNKEHYGMLRYFLEWSVVKLHVLI